ncbi:uncharacterized protein ARMOST_16443 [Armillaria ostoyae]|uniref:Uncharacterized protein n=1 Tax=Armillaria ostoyae TaxID=47428 RepID=A0A284RW88_ARMOS|nr:uncharacterized protein ARMOST_16443 [Armillaria ostoyae]
MDFDCGTLVDVPYDFEGMLAVLDDYDACLSSVELCHRVFDDPETLKAVVELVAETAETAVSLNASFISLGIDSQRGVHFLTVARGAGFKGSAILNVVRVKSFLDALAHMEVSISYQTRRLHLDRRIMESQNQDADTDTPAKHIDFLELFAV